MPNLYDLPFLSFPDQIAKLQSRGLQVDDPGKGAKWLERIGYYRLAPYWRAMQDEHGNFSSQASLARAVDLYLFDVRLRHCLLPALEKFEVAIRVQISHAIGRRGVFGHREISSLDPSKGYWHAEWLSIADAQLDECREDWLEAFRAEFSGEVPTWMAIEAWSFAIVSKLYGLMNLNDQAAIAKKFMVNRATLASWLRACVDVRNSCAHHNRLWNKPLINQPAVPKTWEAKQVQHIGQSRQTETRVYAVFAILAHVAAQIGGGPKWKKSVKDLSDTFPNATGLSLSSAGFPLNWRDEPLWN